MPNTSPTDDKSTPAPAFVGQILNPTNVTRPVKKAAPKKRAPAKKAPARGKAAPVPAGDLGKFINAIMQEESGGNYGAVGPAVHGDHAYGKYQIMGANIPGWSKQILGRSITVAEYLANPELQERIAQGKLTQYYNKYGAAGAASAWFTGSPTKYLTSPGASDGGTTASHYVNNVLSLMGKASSTLPDPGTASTALRTSAGDTSFSAPSALKAQVAKDYGYLAGFMDDPELGPLLTKAAKEGWDSATLQGALYNTSFYKNHSATTRQWDAQTKLDPATQRAQVAAQVSDLAAQARKSGLNFQPGRLAVIAVNSLRFGWNAQQTTNALLAEGKFDTSGKTPNAAFTTASDLKTRAAQYMVPLSDASLTKWIGQITSGQISETDFDAYLKEQAKSLFPALASALDRGVTVEQYASPYREQAAQLLEVDPQSIDFMKNPTYQKALFQKDPKTGENTAMSLADWSNYLRTLPDYAKTHQANQQAAAFGTSLAQTFGKIAS